MEYFRKLTALLDLEKKADMEQFRELTERSGAAERRSAGVCWYPVAIRGSEWVRGDYIAVEFERTTHQDVPHQLRFGMPAALFTNHDPAASRLDGVITHLNGNTLKITFRTEELPDWSGDGKLGIDLLFDDNSYDQMRDALRAAETRVDKEKDACLIKVLTGLAKPVFEPQDQMAMPEHLNESQRVAVIKIREARDLAIVHGPPGTGKTTTLIQAIKDMAQNLEGKILVTAPSNTAVDLLADKLSDQGISLVRVGNPARVSEKLMNLTFESKMSNHPMMKEIKALKKRANEFRNLAHKYKRQFGKAERDQRKALFDEAYRILKDVSKTELYILDDIIAKTKIMCATLVGANHYTVRDLNYHTVVIDEAGQALEPAAWIPIMKAQRVILAGDHFQLPPTIKSPEAARNGLSETLLEKSVSLHPEAVVMLDVQYRMNDIIAGYASQQFYQDRLRAHPSVGHGLMFPGDAPLVFLDTAGCGFEEKLEGPGVSNPEEAHFLLKHLEKYLGEVMGNNAPPAQPSIAVISPYRKQIELMAAEAHGRPGLKIYGNNLTVNTIDSFQGQERDIVYISMTRSNADQRIGFLSELRRMNVAMTRARKKLVVVGDSATLSRLPYYEGFIRYAEQHGGYHSAWEFIE